MLKKRLIFTLLYNDGGFMLSRNFRLQRAGDIVWLLKNYKFNKISFSIDELIILDVTRRERNIKKFCDHIKMIVKECFVPVAIGGGITSLNHARILMNSGADKLVVNSALIKSPPLVNELVGLYGSQCVVASVDFKKEQGEFVSYIENGTKKVEMEFIDYLKYILNLGVGEIYLNSMDRDGTGHGYLTDILDEISNFVTIPIIMAGGAGNWQHLLEGLKHNMIDAVATANLFNFIGQGFPNARKKLIEIGINLARWYTMS